MASPQPNQNVRHLRRAPAFIAIGVCAGVVHWCAVVLLVERAAIAPLLANAMAWALAFAVSFAGHTRWTFGDRAAPVARRVRRFLIVSVLGFLINEATLAMLLSAHTHYALAVIASMAAAAVSTYVLGERWAFASGGAAE